MTLDHRLHQLDGLLGRVHDLPLVLVEARHTVHDDKVVPVVKITRPVLPNLCLLTLRGYDRLLIRRYVFQYLMNI